MRRAGWYQQQQLVQRMSSINHLAPRGRKIESIQSNSYTVDRQRYSSVKIATFFSLLIELENRIIK